MMKTFTKNLLAVGAAVLMFAGCDIKPPDFFVPDVVFTGVSDGVTFDNTGGTRTLTVAANCDWTIFCPADWVELSVTEGNLDGTVTITVGTSKLERTTTVTVFSNEIDTRLSEINIVQTGVIEISKVEKPTILKLITADGKTASFSSSYSGISLSETDVITGGFTLVPAGGGTTVEYTAVVDPLIMTLKYDADDLEPELEYTCTAWAKLNDDPKVVSEALVFATKIIPPAVTSVAKASVMGAKSDDGTSAKLKSSFETVSIRPADVITAGFLISPQVGGSSEISAVVDDASQTFTADLTGLTTGQEYTVTAWAKLNDETRVEAAAAVFTPAISIPVTIVVDFTSNDAWNLPEKNGNIVAVEMKRTVGDYEWTFYGACFEGGSLWLASVGKKGYNGFLKSQKLEGLTVKSIRFPNDGSGLSGNARVTLWVSEDGGNSFSEVPGCIGVDTRVSYSPLMTLPDQAEGCVYMIENVDVGGTNGYSKTTKMTIEAVR